MRRFVLLLLTSAFLSPLAASAEDPYLGKSVFWKEGAQAKVGTRYVDIDSVPFPATVGKVEGEWLWLEGAWLRKRDVRTVDEALAYYTDEIRRDPSDAAWWDNRASVWKEKGEIDNAIKDYTESIRLDPQYAWSYNNRGNAWFDKGECDIAIKDYTEAIRLDPSDPFAYRNRGDAWTTKKDYEKAVKDLSEAIRLDPGYAAAYDSRGDAWMGEKAFDKAIADYSQAIRLDPTEAGYYFRRAWALSSNRDYDKAVADYKEAIRLDPEWARPYNGLAWLRATCPDETHRDGAEAVAMATKACELAEWKYDGWIDTLAAAHAEAGDFTKAIEQQKKAINLSKDDATKKEYGERLALYEGGKPFRAKE